MTEPWRDILRDRDDVSQRHVRFLERALPTLARDSRLVGVAAGGSFITATMDRFSDLDLIVAVEPDAAAEVMSRRREIAVELGDLLAAFTGEHVGEPRVLICLYGPPLLHVDLKFVALTDAAERVEDPIILWERDARLSTALEAAGSTYPAPDLQWIEDRFWVWVHYGADKIARGELFEAHDFLAFLRFQVLGPLALQAHGARPMGVRRLERDAGRHLSALRKTLAAYDGGACADALLAAAVLYRSLCDELGGPPKRHAAAERATLAYLDELRAGLPPTEKAE